jgi:hypothetical protein
LRSPLTQYLALCGNHPPETVHIPLEHRQLLQRLRSLDYQESEDSRRFQLDDMAMLLGEVLGQIPGFIADLCDLCGGEEPALTHLELVLSASELALLPFEMARAPGGAPAAGQELTLQSRLPLSLTRRARRIDNSTFRWPSRIRVLFAAAAPRGVRTIPVDAHLLALRSALDPWIGYRDGAANLERIEDHLVFLPRASLEEIEEHCRCRAFSHVHLLTHGVPVADGVDERFGLALHKAGDPEGMDIVTGERLATALRCFRSGDRGLSTPAVVTLASCDSGRVGTVLGPGASIAHALHESGIPLVVASQFPLSFSGSVWLVQEIYEALLWGRDPRVALAHLRRKLSTQVPDRHDWASLVAYAALPEDLEEQLRRFRKHQANTSVHNALDSADHIVATIVEGDSYYSASKNRGKADPELFQTVREDLERTRRRLARGKERLRNLAMESGDVLGLLASACKREAEVLYEASNLFEGEGESFRPRSSELLHEAKDLYRQVFEQDPTASWAVAQYLSLSMILEEKVRERVELWRMAAMLARLDSRQRTDRRHVWGLSTLSELYLLAPLVLPDDAPERASSREQALRHTRELAQLAERFPIDLYAARRQLRRYGEFFQFRFRELDETLETLVATADELVALLPETSPMSIDDEGWLQEP